jgi:formylglycine-generating enzyme required for sulfatase activity
MKALLLATVAVAAAIASLPIYTHFTRPEITVVAETVTIPPGDFTYRPAGRYRVYGKLVDPPLETGSATEPLEIMRFQVSRADYAACVADGVCDAPLPAPLPAGAKDTSPSQLPQTGVNWYDATTYAKWYSAKTRQTWRLPDDVEWQRAAAERFVDDAVEVEQSDDDPAQRWLAAYERNVATRGSVHAEPQPRGTYGKNSHGVSDLSGNVWEWTATCVSNVTLDPGNTVAADQDPYCGAHVAEGRHRAVVVDLVRNPKVGGCAVGIPPDYVGFRLVRER